METEVLYRKGGPELVDDLKNNVRVCKTGEAKTTKGHKLMARFVIHTVGPRYNVKYVTAAESALYSCYRNVLKQVRENGMKTVACPCIHSIRRGYPSEDGAHIAISEYNMYFRRKFKDTYMELLPLYFPRCAKEEAEALKKLPEDIGNEDGEPIIPERQIRILDKPTINSIRKQNVEDFEQTVDLNKEFGTSTVLEVGKHPFAHMEQNPDDRKHVWGKTSDEQRKREMRQRYERLLKRSKTEDLTDIAALRCLYRTGVDRFGRPVVIFVGKHFPSKSIDLERALLYLIRVMEPVVESDYVVVYFHTQTTSENHPPMAYLKHMYSILDNKYRRNLKAFYIVHPTWWSKLATWFFTTFTASDIKKRVYSLKGVQYLYGSIFPDQLDIPQFVTNYDIQDPSVIHGSSKSSFEDKRCRCVCPVLGKDNTTVQKKSVTIRDNLDPNFCKCEYVLDNPPPNVCAQCECQYESRNTTTIKVVVIFVICVVSLLFVYMLFLLCLDPLIARRPSSYQQHTNEEVNMEEVPSSASATPQRAPMLSDQMRQRSIIDRVSNEQKRWKGTVEEQRKQIYDRHKLLN
ncbi:hypothetical protein FSP39_002249 [Pinctada imbricata]|uniref:Uncharacterized protein n=1 Tax=Pinctada imbricata TaxID=66713 RepID=A0AA88Y718_PINIB|nr:hypothetical protein FSP39_002249 [Pinctada imbricata]